MESVDRSDKYLDPPDGNLFSHCDECGKTFATEDLIHIRKYHQWLCQDCFCEATENENENNALKNERPIVHQLSRIVH